MNKHICIKINYPIETNDTILWRTILDFNEYLNFTNSFFYLFIPENGYKNLRIIKEKQTLLKNNKNNLLPLITNKEENLLLYGRTAFTKNEILYIVFNSQFEISEKDVFSFFQNSNSLTYGIDIYKKALNDVDIVTPLNKRGEDTYFKLSILISNLSINIYPFFIDSTISKSYVIVYLLWELLKKFDLEIHFQGWLLNYSNYLDSYFGFSDLENQEIKEKINKYSNIYRDIFQNNVCIPQKDILDSLIKKCYNIMQPKSIIINDMAKEDYWMLFHWLCNNMRISFAKETFIMNVLKTIICE